MRKLVVFIFSILILISLLFNGCISFENENDKNKETKYSYIYKINIILNESENYYVYLPALIDSQNKSLLEINNDLEIINGKGVYKTINSEKGYVLNISSNESLTLLLNKEYSKKPIFHDYMIMSNEFPDSEFDGIKYWIFLNHSKLDNKIELDIELWENYSYYINGDGRNQQGGYFTYHSNQLIYKNGWQIIEGRDKGIQT